jgi:hypothetical protein
MEDILIGSTELGFDVINDGGDCAPAYSIENIAILALFGGMVETGANNAESPISQNLSWWGNRFGEDSLLTSSYQQLLRQLPASPTSLGRLEAVAEADLTAALGSGWQVRSRCSITNKGQIHNEITITGDNKNLVINAIGDAIIE